MSLLLALLHMSTHLVIIRFFIKNKGQLTSTLPFVADCSVRYSYQVLCCFPDNTYNNENVLTWLPPPSKKKKKKKEKEEKHSLYGTLPSCHSCVI
ncbi:hypothetical protein BDF22DRAFT_662816 [Syncephalis plumigaleata]|nr:hypothetical protein BDF22DRAFT_662816 [Syncephalis plumigaleata]